MRLRYSIPWLVTLMAAVNGGRAETYPAESWPDSAELIALNGTTDTETGLPHIAKGTRETSTPSFIVWLRRKWDRLASIVEAAAELRVVREADLTIGVFPGRYMLASQRKHYPGETGVGAGKLDAGDDVYYVYLNSANTLQIVPDATGWPADPTAYLPLAEVTVSGGTISAIDDVRHRTRTATALTLQELVGITPADGTCLVGTGSVWTGKTGADVRTAIGMGSSVQAWDADLDAIAAVATTGCLERTGQAMFGTWPVSTFGKSLLDDDTMAAARATLVAQASSTNLTAIAAASATGNTCLVGSPFFGFQAKTPAQTLGVLSPRWANANTTEVAFGLLRTNADATADLTLINDMATPGWGIFAYPDGVGGNPQINLRDDLAALSAVSTTGILACTVGDTTFTTRTILAEPGSGLTVTYTTGVAGNPDVQLPLSLRTMLASLTITWIGGQAGQARQVLLAAECIGGTYDYVHGRLWIASTEYGAPEGSGHTLTDLDADGTVLETIMAHGDYRLLSDAGGTFSFTITDTAGGTWYAMLELAGKVYSSGAIVIAAP